MTRRRVKKRTPRLGPEEEAAVNAYLEQPQNIPQYRGGRSPLAMEEQSELRRAAQQIIDGRAELKRMRDSNVASARRKMLKQIEDDFCNTFVRHGIYPTFNLPHNPYSIFKFDDGLIVTFKSKGGTGHTHPIFTR
jgi:hypothetical protein